LKKSFAPNLYIALAHHPVVNKNGDTITSAVTNLDLHDISRSARTYGAKKFFVVTPLEDQKNLVGQIISHWVTGFGGSYNPKRRQALELIQVENSLGDVVENIAREEKGPPRIVVTSAREDGAKITCKELRTKLESGNPHLLIFGTAWGLCPEVIDAADYLLEPIRGKEAYNHLSVRSASAIILDRLLAC
jgi:hypothetical protein